VTTGVVQVQTTLDTDAAAHHLGDLLVAERLAACVQVTGPVHSIYRWKGRVESANEWLLLIKTSEEVLPRLLPRVRALHPYDTPEIIVLPVMSGDPDYLAWVRENIGSEKGEARTEK